MLVTCNSVLQVFQRSYLVTVLSLCPMICVRSGYTDLEQNKKHSLTLC